MRNTVRGGERRALLGDAAGFSAVREQVGDLRADLRECDSHSSTYVQRGVAGRVPGNASGEKHLLSEGFDGSLDGRAGQQHAHRLGAEASCGYIDGQAHGIAQHHAEASPLSVIASNLAHGPLSDTAACDGNYFPADAAFREIHYTRSTEVKSIPRRRMSHSKRS